MLMRFVRIFVLLAGAIMSGCVAPAAGPAEATEETAISVSAWSVDGDFVAVADYFLSAAREQTGGAWLQHQAEESSTVVFQVGHADADEIESTGVPPWSVIPKDTRYAIQSMCQTLAHGPQTNCNGQSSTADYACPGYWDPFEGDWVGHRSVYDRWGEFILNQSDIRMVCGSSTLHSPSTDGVNYLWNLLKLKDKAVADALMDSLAGAGVAVCFTLGGGSASESPLVADGDFVTYPNELAGTYYHLQYSEPFLGPAADDPAYVSYHKVEDFVQPELYFPGCLPQLAVDDSKGSDVKSFDPRMTYGFDMGRSEDDYWAKQPGGREGVEESLTRTAIGLNEETDWFADEQFSGEFLYGSHIMLEIVPIDKDLAATNGIEVTHKSSFVTLRRRIDVTSLPGESDEHLQRTKTVSDALSEAGMSPQIPVIGPGGRITAYMNPDSSLISALRVARPVIGVTEWLQTRSPEEAYVDALKDVEGGLQDSLFSTGKLHDEYQGDTPTYLYHDPFVLDNELTNVVGADGYHYRLNRWGWGYFEGAAQIEQSGMSLWYHFQFTPIDDSVPNTPIDVWRPGFEESPCP